MLPRRRIGLLLASVAILVFAPCGGAQNTPAGFVQLIVNREFPFQFLRAVVEDEDQPYIQFNSLMQDLEINIRYDPGLRSASGFLPESSTRFVLSLERNTVVIGDVTQPIPPGAVKIVENQLYVLWSAYNDWLPATLTWSSDDYELKATTRYVLVSQERKRLEIEHQRLLLEKARIGTEGLMRRNTPWFDPGMNELRLSSAWATNEPNAQTATLTGVQRFFKGDLEYSATKPAVGGDGQPATLDYGRASWYDDAQTYQATAGDTFSAFSPLVMEVAAVRGGSFYTGVQPDVYGRTVLVGTAPPGSTVDLYRLGVLVDFATIGANGQYRFENLPLGLGTTLFELKIFTPDGRRFVDYRQVSSQQNMLAPGSVATNGAAGFGQSQGVPLDVRGGEARVGLLPSLTLGGYAIRLENFNPILAPIVQQDINGATLQWRPWDPLVILAERAQDSRGLGSANRYRLFLGSELGTLAFDYRAYSESFAPPGRVRSTLFSEPALLNTVLETDIVTRLGITNLSLQRRDSDYGDTRRLAENRLQIDRRIIGNLSGLLTLSQQIPTESGLPENEVDTEQALIGYRIDSLQRLEAQIRATQTVLTTDSTENRFSYIKTFELGSPWAYRGTVVNRSPGEDTVEASVGYLFTNGLRFNSLYVSDGTWFLQLNYALPFRISGQGAESFPPNSFRKGGVEGVVYVDENGDGARQPSEPTVPNAADMVPGATSVRSDAQGHFRAWGMPSGSPIGVQLDPLGTDALYLPAQERLRTLIRPGELAQIDIAVVPGSGLDGTIVAPSRPGAPQAKAGPPREVSPVHGLRLVLQPVAKGTPRIALVEWDGTFVIETIRPGTYRLVADPEQLEKMGLRLIPPSLDIVIPSGANPVWLENLRFTLGAADIPPGGEPPNPVKPAQ